MLEIPGTASLPAMKTIWEIAKEERDQTGHTQTREGTSRKTCWQNFRFVAKGSEISSRFHISNVLVITLEPEMAIFSNYQLIFALLSVLHIADLEARPRSLEDLERLKVLDEIRDLSSVITLIDIPEDNTPKGPEDEDDNGSGTENTENAQCRGLFNNIQDVNASANGTKDAPDLIHANYDTLCDKTDNDKIKKLPVYIVGWELKEHCGDVNTIPFKRFRLDEYHAKKPRFDIPGMCIPMVRLLSLISLTWNSGSVQPRNGQ